MKRKTARNETPIGVIQSLLASVRSLDPTTTAELGAIHSLRMHVAAPLHQMIEEALTWLENVDSMVSAQLPSLGLAAPVSSLPQSFRVLWQVSFAAQCDLTEAARDLDLTGCGWEEALERCETSSRQIKESLRQVVGAVEDLHHLERLEANAAISSLDESIAPAPKERTRLARGSEHNLQAAVTNTLSTVPQMRPTNRYPESVIEQLVAESELDTLCAQTVPSPEMPKRRTRASRAPLTLDSE